jgi:hypothetical protein
MTSMTRTGVQNVEALAAYRPIGPPITRLARRTVGSSQLGLDRGAGERITRSCHAPAEPRFWLQPLPEEVDVDVAGGGELDGGGALGELGGGELGELGELGGGAGRDVGGLLRVGEFDWDWFVPCRISCWLGIARSPFAR